MTLIGLLLATAVVFAVYAVFRGISVRNEVHLLLSGALLLGGVAILIWWLAFSPTGLPRHAVMAPLLVAFGVAFMGASAPRKWRVVFALVLAVGLGCMLQGRYGVISYLAADLMRPWTQSAHLSAQLEAADYLSRLRREHRVVLLGCGSERVSEIDYLLPGTGNIKNCLTFRAPQSGQVKVFLVRRADWLPIPDFMKVCNETLFRKCASWACYSVSRCPVFPGAK